MIRWFLTQQNYIGTGLQNLRECILWTQTKHDFEPKVKKPFWKQMSVNFIERYCYLICFTTYVKLYAPRGIPYELIIFYNIQYVKWGSITKMFNYTYLQFYRFRFYFYYVDGCQSRTSRNYIQRNEKLQLGLKYNKYNSFHLQKIRYDSLLIGFKVRDLNRNVFLDETNSHSFFWYFYIC